MDSFPTLENTIFMNQVKKHTILFPSHDTDKTINNIEKLTITIPSNNFNHTNEHYFNIIDDSSFCKNKTTKFENNNTSESFTSACRTNVCSKPKIDSINKSNNKKNMHKKILNNKQKNISFSSQKLWEINRANQILHNKISHDVKSTYLIQNPSTFMVKASSTINRERENKDVVKKNEILAKKLKNVKSTFYKK